MQRAALFCLVVSFLPAPRGQGETGRPLPPWPPPEGKLRLIIDTDAANEIDDQYALALALGFRERLTIEGLVAVHYGLRGGSEGIEKSWREIQNVLEKAGLGGQFPVKRGSDPIVYTDRPPESEGVDFIIERARAASPDDPLWLVLLGPATDAATALLKAPEIADRLVVYWHGRTQWPVQAWNFNAFNDIKAVQVIFEVPCRLVLFDTGTYLRIPPEETAKRYSTLGPLGAYLHQIRMRHAWTRSPRKAFYDLGDIAALVSPSCARWPYEDAPAVRHDLRYDFSKRQGTIIRIYHVETATAASLLRNSAETARTAPQTMTEISAKRSLAPAEPQSAGARLLPEHSSRRPLQHPTSSAGAARQAFCGTVCG